MINNPTFQTCVTIVIVILCAAWLVVRLWMWLKRKKTGCGCDDSGNCAARESKQKLAKTEKAVGKKE